MLDLNRCNLVREQWQSVSAQLVEMAEAIWARPELPNMEYKASAWLCDWLQNEGFEVERGVCQIPTAFRATYSRGSGPCVALLAEYDALPGTDNAPVSHRQSAGRIAGHACAHNYIGAANIAAAIAAVRTMQAGNGSGKVVVLGCPSEEIIWGKVAMLDRGAFESIDALLTSHADDRNGVASQPCMSVVGGEFIFEGESSHGGSPNASNALDAAELAIQTVERMRAHHFSDTNAEHIVRKGGQIPNVTPDETRLWVNTRHIDYDRAREVFAFIEAVFAKVAETAKVKFRSQIISSTRGYLPNDTLAEAVFECLSIVGPPQWTANDIDWLAELSAASAPNAAFELDRDIAIHRGGCDFYGQDDGEASWRIPLTRINWAMPKAIPFHNWALSAASGHHAGRAGALMASEALSIATLYLLDNARVIDEAKRELEHRVGSKTLSPPYYGAFETMTKTPAAFWDASWLE